MIKPIQGIKTYLKTKRHKKELGKIHDALLTNPSLLTNAQQRFNKAFGVDQKTRTPRQWKNLVRVYGMETCMAKEQMTKEQIDYFCNESANQKHYRLNDYYHSDYGAITQYLKP